MMGRRKTFTENQNFEIYSKKTNEFTADIQSKESYIQNLVTIIVPCYNEADNILPFMEAVVQVDYYTYDFEIIIVNDGSRDRSAAILNELRLEYPMLRVLHFPRNFGQQQALMAGIRYARGEVLVTIDIDLQQPPELIPEMIKRYEIGFQVVHAIPRYQKDSAPWLKKMTSKLYYKWMQWMGSDGVVYKSNDFRLMSFRVADVLRALPERNLYLRGILAWLCPIMVRDVEESDDYNDTVISRSSNDSPKERGLPWSATTISYDHRSRSRGRSKYTWVKMIRLAMDGITSTSIRPLRFGLFLGGTSILLAMGLTIWAIHRHVIAGQTVAGWTSLIIVILFFSSLQFLLIGLLGEYVGKIFLQVRGRPGYILHPGYAHFSGEIPPGQSQTSGRRYNQSNQRKYRTSKNTNASTFNPEKCWHPPERFRNLSALLGQIFMFHYKNILK